MTEIAKEILYSLGRTSTGQLIEAVNADKGTSYTCPGCSREFVFRKGTLKRPHFAHKALSPNCTPESALHYGFKTLLFNKLQKHLDQQLPLEMHWDCRECRDNHTGNLLKKTVAVKLEHDLGVCKPDIALLDEHGATVAVIEVVVTHAPEQTALNYYKSNHIAVVTFELKSDTDIHRLDSPFLKADSVNVCRNPKCSKCGNYKLRQTLLLVEGNCWKCRTPMKIAAIANDVMGFPDNFTESVIQLAAQNGVFLKSQYSKTEGAIYIANTCRKCGAFIGNHYLPGYISDHSYNLQELDAGYFCLHCY